MPKRTKLPKIDYSGGTAHTKALIQKANPLLTLSQTELSLAELKILDAYLSRINSHEPDKRTDAFKKGELEQYLGITRILKADLDKRLRNLFQVVEIEDKTKKKGFKLVSLFEEADAEQDDDGLWRITLTCTPAAREYVFNLEKIGYFHYMLGEVLNLKSRYSYVMFLYLKRFSNFKTWEIDLLDLKQVLKCDTVATYQEFKEFNKQVLKRAQQEINEKTSLKFSYEPIKRGRSVGAIRFTVETLPKIDVPDVEPRQLSLFEDKSLDFIGGACTPKNSDVCEFSAEQMEQIRAVLAVIPENKLPENVPGNGDLEFRRYHYLAERYAALNAAEARKKAQGETISNRLAYLVGMLKKDAGIE